MDVSELCVREVDSNYEYREKKKLKKKTIHNTEYKIKMN